MVSSSNLGDNRTLAIPVAQTIFWEMGPARRKDMGIAESLIRIPRASRTARAWSVTSGRRWAMEKYECFLKRK